MQTDEIPRTRKKKRKHKTAQSQNFNQLINQNLEKWVLSANTDAPLVSKQGLQFKINQSKRIKH